MVADLPVVTALVLCGGGSRRMGADKTVAAFGESTVLDHLLDALPGDWPVVAVGPERPTHRTARWTRETPTGGGPVAAVAAGLALIATDLVVVLAGDMPFAAPAASALIAALHGDPTVDAVASATGGRTNPLLAAYRTARLRHTIPEPPDGKPARALLVLTHTTLAVPEQDSLDVDTPERLDEARRRVAT